MKILATVQDMTGWSDRDLAAAVGIPPSTAWAYITGTRTEKLDKSQIEALIILLRAEGQAFLGAADLLELAG